MQPAKSGLGGFWLWGAVAISAAARFASCTGRTGCALTFRVLEGICWKGTPLFLAALDSFGSVCLAGSLSDGSNLRFGDDPLAELFELDVLVEIEPEMNLCARLSLPRHGLLMVSPSIACACNLPRLLQPS